MAVFVCGLRENSRIKMKINNQLVSTDTILLAKISDSLNTLVWFQTEDGQKGKNRPTSLTDLLINNHKTNESKDVIVFNSGEDFEKRRNKILKGGE